MNSGKKRYLYSFILLAVLLIAGVILNLCIGSVRIPLREIIDSLKGNLTPNERILWDIRMPRTIAALILGGSLALSGYLLQTFFHNPIAGPFVLGISSGAKMTVAIVMVFFMDRAIAISSGTLILAAFTGSLISLGFVLLMSGRVKNMSMLVVAGVMIGYICSAATELIINFANDAQIVNLHNWSRGSFSGTTWDNVYVMAVIVIIAFAWTFLLSKPMSAYQLGEGYACNLGVNVKLLRVLIVFLSSVLSACIVAFAGPVSFVGVAAPHIVKNILGTNKSILMIPASFMGGGFFVLICDLLARTLFAPTELSVSTVTAIFGAPVVLFIMLKKSREDMR